MKVSCGGRVMVLVCLRNETHRYHWLDFKTLREFVCSCSQEALSQRCWAGDVEKIWESCGVRFLDTSRFKILGA